MFAYGSLRRASGIAVLASLASCLGPTEITIELSTDVACDDVEQDGVSIAVGKPGDDSNAASATGYACSDAGLGTLVVTPSGFGSAVGIRVALAVDASVENCDLAHQFANCIVARRALEFDPHHPLMLPIELEQSCLGKACDPTSTCYKGECVDASVPCVDGTCDIPDAAGPSCGSSTPPVSVASGADPFTPHIAKIASGYVITWIAQGILQGEVLSPTGVVQGSPFVVAAPPTPQKTAPLASDGVGLVTWVQAEAGVYVASQMLDGGLGRQTLNSGTIPLQGVMVPDAGVYQSYLDWGGSVGVWTATPTTGISVTGPITLPKTGASSFGLSRNTANVYVSFALSAGCSVLACNEFFTCAEPDVFDEPPCTQIRFAPSDTTWAATVHDTGGDFLVTPLATNKVYTQMPTPDDVDALMPVMTSTAVHTLEEIGDVLYDVASMTSMNAIDPQATGFHGAMGSGAGFDAVADDPSNQPGYAVVYWKSGEIFFTRPCIL